MRPPAIPPDRALAIGGVVSAEVAATLAEARRIRDGWAEALRAAEASQSRAHAARLRRALGALRRVLTEERRQMVDEAIDLAEALASRAAAEQVEVRALVGALQPEGGELTASRLRVRVSPELAQAFAEAGAPADIEVVPDGALVGPEIVVETHRGRLDGRAATRVGALLPAGRVESGAVAPRGGPSNGDGREPTAARPRALGQRPRAQVDPRGDPTPPAAPAGARRR